MSPTTAQALEQQPITLRVVGLVLAALTPFFLGGVHAINTLGDIRTEIALLRRDLVNQSEKVSTNGVGLNERVTIREMDMWVRSLQVSNEALAVPAFGKQ